MTNRRRFAFWLAGLALATAGCADAVTPQTASGSISPSIVVPSSTARSTPMTAATSQPTPNPTPAQTSTPPPAPTPRPTAVATPTAPAADVVITGKAYEFTPANVTGPADQPLTIAFENLDGAFTTHNLHLTNPDGSDVLVGEFFHGPATKTYTVDALTAGTYPFVCDVHSDMKGTLTIE